MTDPLPPLRNSFDFYQTQFELEFLQKDNRIVEDVNPDPKLVDEQSTLDTLYKASGNSLPQPSVNPYNVVMTYYHGPSHAPLVFSGFNFWSFRRDECVQLVDFVLQELWGLPRSSVASRTPPAPSPVASRGRRR